MDTAQRSGQVVSHYQIEEVLGSGGMGEVYRGTDLRLGRCVALKFVRPFADRAMRDRLIQEARAAALLDHPNICTIYEVDETDAGEVFIAMAYYEGETLDRILARGPVPFERARSCPRPTTPGICSECVIAGWAMTRAGATRISSASRP